jgi:hypothetical protein
LPSLKLNGKSGASNFALTIAWTSAGVILPVELMFACKN